MKIKKILVEKKKKEYVHELGREIVLSKGKFYYIKDASKDYHTSHGLVSKADLKKREGTTVTSKKGKEFNILKPIFVDKFKKMQRKPQIIPLKDIGMIITTCGITRDSVIVDAGTGSGALACYLGAVAKRVHSYDIRDDHIKIAKENAKMLGLKNVTIKELNIYDGIPHKNVDVVTLDVPEPWEALPAAFKALKVGGFVVSYSPSIPQTVDMANTLAKMDGFYFVKTCELIEREWEVQKRKVRPTSQIIHSGFLTFARKISR